jgi:hypothetical protein
MKIKQWLEYVNYHRQVDIAVRELTESFVEIFNKLIIKHQKIEGIYDQFPLKTLPRYDSVKQYYPTEHDIRIIYAHAKGETMCYNQTEQELKIPIYLLFSNDKDQLIDFIEKNAMPYRIARAKELRDERVSREKATLKMEINVAQDQLNELKGRYQKVFGEEDV